MSRLWYLASLVPLVIGGAVAYVVMSGLMHDIEGMQRVVVPGEATLALEAGDHVVYGELVSIVDGVAYMNTSFRVRCAVTGPEGASAKLVAASSKASYGMGGYQGESLFELNVSESGSYRFSCEGDDKPAVVAIGQGIGSAIVLGISAGLAGFIGVVVVFFVIRRLRRQAATRMA